MCLDGFVDGYGEFVDELRTWDTDRVVAARDAELVEIRRREARVLAMTFVLDERDCCTVG